MTGSGFIRITGMIGLRWAGWALVVGMAVLLMGSTPARATTHDTRSEAIDMCPVMGVQPRGADFQPGGIIMTTFDSSALWVYEIERQRRYPLPDTVPCATNCHLSRDFRWITFFNDSTNSYNKMRMDGTQRTFLVDYAGDVDWWTPDTLLVWTPAHDAYLRAETGSTHREYLQVNGVLSVQPGGRWGLVVEPEGDGFRRALVNLELRGLINVREQRVELGPDIPYFNSAAWSPDGQWLAYVGPGAVDPELGIRGSEIFGVRTIDTAPAQWTDLATMYGAVRINGRAVGQLSWSPDSTRLAFWVMALNGPDPTTDAGEAVIHVLDTRTGALVRYCGYSTTEHTPNPPRLLWSPDGTSLAFGGNVPGDNRGYLLIALDTGTGRYTELSEGIYPALGTPDVIAWGLPP